MLKNPIALGVLALLVIGGGVWLYLYSTDPMNMTCKDVNADPHVFGIQAADAVYDSLSERAKARTTREVTRMHVVTFCGVNDDSKVLSVMRDDIERSVSAAQ